MSKYERGDIPGSWDFLKRLHETEGIDLNWLLCGDPSDNGDAA